MRAEHWIVLVVGTLALLFFVLVMRSPSARAEMKRREMRRDFRRSLVNRENGR